MDIDLITLGLKLAFRQPGCPICQLQQRLCGQVGETMHSRENDVEVQA